MTCPHGNILDKWGSCPECVDFDTMPMPQSARDALAAADKIIKGRPILFSAPMVQAILDGRKTQTRRIVKWSPIEPGLNLAFSGLEVGHYNTGNPASGFVLYSRRGDGVWNQRTKPLHCPFGTPGDRLWVRETWGSNETEGWGWIYRADGIDDPETAGCIDKRWHPSIHMPRRASRINLEVTGVRIERLQKITEEDARREGVGHVLTDDLPEGMRREFTDAMATQGRRGAFALLWDRINGDRANWKNNPWVWVVEFRKIDK